MVYNLCILLYDLLVHIAALFGGKARLLVKGHRQVFSTLSAKIQPTKRYVWFHAASLGEFEQGRPLIERLRKQDPSMGIVLTFFSPSGYEVRKHYEGADVVCYLPFDRPCHVRQFIGMVKPTAAFFIKYEFWKNYLDELHRRGVDTYSISSVFRPNQVFFQWWGRRYSKVLLNFTRLFVQNEASKTLLANIGVDRVSVVGDTRFDRVLEIHRASKELPIVEAFKGEQLTIVAGSTWPADEDLLIDYFNHHPEVKLIIAPHVISQSHIDQITRKLTRPWVRYTQVQASQAKEVDCLIIDCFGLLSSIYRYGEIAYVGGGFGAGIHNTLEAAVYGIPVVFGPNHKHFREAIGLLQAGGAFAITDAPSLDHALTPLLNNPQLLNNAGQQAGSYVAGNVGATEAILKELNIN